MGDGTPLRAGDDRDLPAQARGESEGMRYRLRARHRLQEPETAVDRASDQEIVAMFGPAARPGTG
ncbi:hypothetical protein Scani_82210 [Streptomyces caniferus]|uniref:Uncharacterized protein n=1 Tax=Streptomyces caniferus TaxID=285557 RepID=A0A640SPA7_9ACTN|nr:hypothetical protein Scani_33660 [Streptomyces caniferus]GFE11926.1 hypothetical protein Scani_81940 [Streptomyces caniferus]GFE11953.1 hypothetical protein Scani_82210 [Streptomyces caniferus]